MKKLLIIGVLALAALCSPAQANGRDHGGVGVWVDPGGVAVDVGPWGGGWRWGYSAPPYGYEYYRPDYALPGPGVPFRYGYRPYGYDYHGRRSWRRW